MDISHNNTSYYLDLLLPKTDTEILSGICFGFSTNPKTGKIIKKCAK